MLLEPGDQRPRFAIREQINHTVPLEVDEDGAVPVTTTKGKVVDAQDARIVMLGERCRPDGAEQGIGTSRHSQMTEYPSACFAAEGESNEGECSFSRAVRRA
jgi:hypothetical protein